MKILVTSYAYAPSVGGIETVSELMAHAFADQGHEVEVITQTPAKAGGKGRFPVIRKPTPVQLWQAVDRADVVWQNNISLNYLWASLLQRKPTAVTLQCAIFPDFPRKNWRVRLKALLLKHCFIFAISRYVMNDLKQSFELIGNPFDPGFSHQDDSANKDRDIVFVGRLVSDKGGDLLLRSIAALSSQGIKPSCTIIGDGEEKAPLEAMARELGIEPLVRFTGFMQGDALHAEIARHRIMAVPSRWKEPFGIVALEGVAAGCAVVGSSGGGLGDAIGPCGLTFENNDGAALTDALQQLLTQPELIERCRKEAEAHLEKFSVESQSKRYLETFAKLIR